MTCVVGIAEKGRVYLGGDSIAIAGYDMHVRDTPKVFRRGSFIVGCAGSFRLADVIRYHLPPTPPPSGDLHRYMATTWVETLREACKARGVSAVENNAESFNGELLVGVGGMLFVVEDDFQVGQPSGGICAIGCGSALAMGALHALGRTGSPRRRMTKALSAAAAFNAGVRAPFNFITLPRSP